MSKKYRWAGNTYVNRSKTLFEEKLVKINKLKEFELEISEAFEPNVAARQQRVMATLTVRGRLKEKWDLKILLTRLTSFPQNKNLSKLSAFDVKSKR